jgi:hypothetical protein
MNNNQRYEVEKIIKKGIDSSGKVYYKLKWKHFPEAQSTWEPADNLGDIIDLINTYEIELKKKQKKYMTTPKKVNYAKYFKNKLYVNVSWKQPDELGYANTNIVLPTTMVTYEEMREKNPKLLIDFYEQFLLYGTKQIKVNNDSTCELI